MTPVAHLGDLGVYLQCHLRHVPVTLIYDPPHDKNNKNESGPKKDSDQLGIPLN